MNHSAYGASYATSIPPKTVSGSSVAFSCSNAGIQRTIRLIQACRLGRIVAGAAFGRHMYAPLQTRQSLSSHNTHSSALDECTKYSKSLAPLPSIIRHNAWDQHCTIAADWVLARRLISSMHAKSKSGSLSSIFHNLSMREAG